MHKVFAYHKKDLAAPRPIAQSMQHVLYPATLKAQEWRVGTLGGKNEKRNAIERGPYSEFNYDPSDNSIPVHRPPINSPEPEPRALTTANIRDAMLDNAGIVQDPSTAAIVTANVPSVSQAVQKIETVHFTTEL